MLKIKLFLVTTFLVFSTYSITYASTVFPISTNNLDSPYDSADRDSSWKRDSNSRDNSDRTVTVKEQPEQTDTANGQPEPTDTVNVPLEPKMHTVAAGDNLYRIALTYNVSLESLMSWNNLTSYSIYPGDELKVFGEEVNEVDLKSNAPEKQEELVSNPITPAIVESKEKIDVPPPEEMSKEMVVTATAYTAYCTGCSGTTAYGIDLRANPNQKVIAVDPRVIPLGTMVWVEGYGEAIAGDTGGAIKGNKIDVFIPSHENAMAWGVKTVKLKVLY